MKKAYIVKFEIRTRVESENPEQAIEQAIEKVLANADQYVTGDNACWPTVDVDMPTEEQEQACNDAREYIRKAVMEAYRREVDFSDYPVEEDEGPDEYYGIRTNTYHRVYVDSSDNIHIEYEYYNGHDHDDMELDLNEVSDSLICDIADAIKEAIDNQPAPEYVHIGYWNNPRDLSWLDEDRDAGKIVKAMQIGIGEFHTCHDPNDIYKDGYANYRTTDGKYLVVFDFAEGEFDMDVQNCSSYVDVYKLKEK